MPTTTPLGHLYENEAGPLPPSPMKLFMNLQPEQQACGNTCGSAHSGGGGGLHGHRAGRPRVTCLAIIAPYPVT